jgi:hypothetical protein
MFAPPILGHTAFYLPLNARGKERRAGMVETPRLLNKPVDYRFCQYRRGPRPL